MPLQPRLAKAPQAEFKALLGAVRFHRVATRSELATLCELPRSSVTLRVRELMDAGLLVELDGTEATGGRRAGRLALTADAGIVLAIELGSTHARWRLADFAATSLADGGFPIRIASGADEVLGQLEGRVRHALEALDLSLEAVRACAVGFPGPVNFADGRVTGPPHMAGWDHAPVPALLSRWVQGPIVVDNDVNVMAWGEYDAKWRPEDIHDLLFIKHGTGIGCGIIANGQIYRGYDGTAGEVGHISVADLAPETMCSCGSKNCLEVVASGRALVNRLKAQGYQVETASDVSALVVQGDLVAMSMVRDAGKALGAVMSGIVSFFNPAVIVMGGSLGALEISLLAGMREATYAQATMFSTRHLRIVPSSLGPEAGLHGATLLALDLAYDAAIERVEDRGKQLVP